MSKEGTFIIYCIESYKLHRAMTGKETYVLFEKYDVFSYLRAFYDVLHTTGEAYINKDIDDYLQARGYITKKAAPAQ